MEYRFQKFTVLYKSSIMGYHIGDIIYGPVISASKVSKEIEGTSIDDMPLLVLLRIILEEIS